jgi:coenzyme F420-0:L-glutamate ligase/coenzyme F420-1:gamma-L-glutamate ligase
VKVEAWGVGGLPEVRAGDDLALMIAQRVELRDGDVLVVAQKVISKAEGRLCDLRSVRPSQRALDYAAKLDDDARVIQLILDESVRVVRDERVLIVETRHGFVCANAGIDHSNVEADETVVLLPVDPDASAGRLRARLREVTGREVGVIVSDTFGRPWRMGIANVALGVAGVTAVIDHRGRRDDFGRELTATVIAVADEMAGTAELVMGKTCRVPAVVLRGWTAAEAAPGTGQDLIRPAELDLFR